MCESTRHRKQTEAREDTGFRGGHEERRVLAEALPLGELQCRPEVILDYMTLVRRQHSARVSYYPPSSDTCNMPSLNRKNKNQKSDHFYTSNSPNKC